MSGVAKRLHWQTRASLRRAWKSKGSLYTSHAMTSMMAKTRADFIEEFGPPDELVPPEDRPSSPDAGAVEDAIIAGIDLALWRYPATYGEKAVKLARRLKNADRARRRPAEILFVALVEVDELKARPYRPKKPAHPNAPWAFFKKRPEGEPTKREVRRALATLIRQELDGGEVPLSLPRKRRGDALDSDG